MHVNNQIILLRNMRRNIRDKVDHSNERKDFHHVNEQYFLLPGVLIESSEHHKGYNTQVHAHKHEEEGISQILYSQSGCVLCRHLFPNPWVLIKWREDPSAVQAAWIHSQRTTDELPWVFFPHCVHIRPHVQMSECVQMWICFCVCESWMQLFISFSCVNMLFVLIFVSELGYERAHTRERQLRQ